MMGRIRTVKPELMKHEDLYDLERQTGLPIRIAFIGLFTCCDRDGRFKWRPRALKLDILPYDEIDFSRVLDALWSRGFVVKYTDSRDEYGAIPTFTKHQVINNKEMASELPDPEESSYISYGCTRDSRVDHASSTPLFLDQGEGKGREGKGREEEGAQNTFNHSLEINLQDVDKNEKSKEQEPSSKSGRTNGVVLKTFLDQVAAKGEKPISSHKPLWDYCERVGLTKDMVTVAWGEFLRKYGPDGRQSKKRYVKWKEVFTDSVQENWFRLWYFDAEGNPKLTSNGLAAEKDQHEIYK